MQSRYNLLILIMLFFTLINSAKAQDSLNPELKKIVDRVDGQVAAEYVKDNLGSITVGLIADGNLVWTKSYGMADTEKKIAASQQTIYRIGSITKQFTAIMLLQLAQEGKVRLTDPVEKYFPEVNKIQGRNPGAPPITLIQLATHTSGLAPEPDNTPNYLKGPVSNWEKVLIAALSETEYAFEPGTRYSYSNIGYAILGAALGRAANQPYVDYVKNQIFKPLGMRSTYFEIDDQMKPRLAKGYLLEDGKIDTAVAEREHDGRGYKVPNGAVYTTAEDLARFVAFELGTGPETVLKKDNLVANFQRIVTATNAEMKRGYGVGFQVIPLGSTVIYGHSGGLAGYQAEAYFSLDAEMGIVILRNAVGGNFSAGSILRKAFEK